MSKTLGPVLATGIITVVNQSVFNRQLVNWRVPVATGLAAGAFALAEKGAPALAEILAWTMLLTVLLTRVDPKIPSPAESALTWWNEGAQKLKTVK